MRLRSGVVILRYYEGGGNVRRQRGEARASWVIPVLKVEGKRRYSFAMYHKGSGAWDGARAITVVKKR